MDREATNERNVMECLEMGRICISFDSSISFYMVFFFFFFFFYKGVRRRVRFVCIEHFIIVMIIFNIG